jgi:hypothetical protein
VADPTPTEDVYRAAAKAYVDSYLTAKLVTREGWADYESARRSLIQREVEDVPFRAAVDAVLMAERERIVQGVRDLTAGDPVTADEVADVVWGGGDRG